MAHPRDRQPAPYEMVPLHAIQVGDFIFYVNDQEFETLKDNPNVIVLDPDNLPELKKSPYHDWPLAKALREMFVDMPIAPAKPFVRVQPKRLTRAQRRKNNER